MLPHKYDPTRKPVEWPVTAHHDAVTMQMGPLDEPDTIALTICDGGMAVSLTFTEEQLERLEGVIKTARYQLARDDKRRKRE